MDPHEVEQAPKGTKKGFIRLKKFCILTNGQKNISIFLITRELSALAHSYRSRAGRTQYTKHRHYMQ